MSCESSRSADDPAVTEIPSVIPIFPLPNVVLFPSTYVPLHIFEPRYREMVRDALAGPRYIGMVLLREGWEADYDGRPPVYEVGCVGRILSAQALVDGRYNIMLRGISRFTITAERHERSYRRAQISLKPDTVDAIDSALREELRALLAVQAHAASDVELSDVMLVHGLASALDFTPLEQQFLLEANTLSQRARRLHDLLALRRIERTGMKGRG